MTAATARQKIAIIGGGVGGITAAFALSDQPGWQDCFDITVYQMGWRLGGKCASGRDKNRAERIYEHGLHIWLGFYNNAFAMLRKCYDQLGRPAGAPLATWQDAFKKHSLVTVMEQINGKWLPWPLDFPTNGEIPGDGGPLPRPWDYVRMLLRWLVDKHEQSPHTGVQARGVVTVFKSLVAEAVDVLTSLGHSVHSTVNLGLGVVAEQTPFRSHLHAASTVADAMDDDPAKHQPGEQLLLIGLVEAFLSNFQRKYAAEIDKNDDLRRLGIWLRLGGAVVVGMLRDGVLLHGFDVLDAYDFTEWLRRHGVKSKDDWWSAPVRGIYELVFGYDQGDINRPNLAAGTALRGTLRMFFAYKGAIFWKMQAGMGDTIFAPLYELLLKRGVKFDYFHRLDNLGVSADGTAVDAIDFGVQATVKAGAYQPLCMVLGLPCWPSEPLYDQLVQGEELKKQGVDLESAWTPWPDVAKKRLRRGVDFDQVVLGVPVGALSYVARELMAANPIWKDMVTHVKTVQTLALQLWFNRTIEEMGWSAPERALVSSFVEPFDTWADMSQLLVREDWPAGADVKNIAYLCGPMQDAAQIPAPFTDPAFPARELARVKAQALEFLRSSVRPLWPKATAANNPEGLNWDTLVDLAGRKGEARLDGQFIRVNIDPGERYVLSVKGSTPFRLQSGASGFNNLTLAGDWTANGLNAGCVEAAAVSGLQATRAISGYPARMIGEKD
jgi:uncharacterized protein with NAD-binding domain and iron-sulfur cluster